MFNFEWSQRRKCWWLKLTPGWGTKSSSRVQTPENKTVVLVRKACMRCLLSKTVERWWGYNVFHPHYHHFKMAFLTEIKYMFTTAGISKSAWTNQTLQESANKKRRLKWSDPWDPMVRPMGPNGQTHGTQGTSRFNDLKNSSFRTSSW